MIQENKIYHGDATEFLRRLPDSYADLIIADPPYSLSKDREFGEGAFFNNRDEWLAWCKQWLTEAKRILTPTGNLFVYAIHHNACFLQTYMWFANQSNSTFHVIREPYKSEERLRHAITKNGKVWTPHPDGRQAGDVWRFPTLAGRRFAEERTEHPTQKPLSLSCRIVKHFSNPGEIVVVPFVGSGSECVAAVQSGRKFVGTEINATFVEIARARIAALTQFVEVVT